ncbi:MAG: hypothetical protein IJS65_07905, partial [Clostridia bacterium]|nr:hypothetical protein [Clostridia bacterium]
MKKTIALLLVLIMVLSLFAACGEKTEAPADSQAQAVDADAEVNVPEDEPDGEDAEKDATEIAPPDAPVIITTGPAAQGQSTDTQQTPQTQTQEPQTQTQTPQTQEPQTQEPQAQAPQTPAPASQTTDPAQKAALGPGVEKSEYMAYFFGDSFMNANAMPDTVIAFARYDGIKLTVRNGSTDTRGSTGLYNIYSKFNFSGSTLTSPKDYTFNSLLTKPNHMDFFVFYAGRDRTITLPENAEQGFQGFKYIQNEYFKANPNGRILLVGPSGYEEGNDGALPERVLLTGKSLKEHNALIKQEVERYYSVAPA